MPRARRIDPTEFDNDDETSNGDDTKDEETTPRRRTRRTTTTEEPTPPRRTRRATADDDDDETPPRRTRRAASKGADEDEDDEADDSIVPIAHGRKDIKKNRPVGEGGDSYFRWDEEPQVIKFLDNEPWSYNQHWVTRDGKQSFPCIGKKCPLCEIGVKSSQKIVYSIVNLSKNGIVQTMEVGVTLEDTLAAYDGDRKTGPLDRLFWALSRNESSRSTSRRSKYNYVFTPIKERDLEEDYEIDLDEAEGFIDEAEIPTTKAVLGTWTIHDLQEIADEVVDR